MNARTIAALATAFTASALPPLAAQQLEIPATELRSLDAFAKRLAKTGLEDDTFSVIRVLETCGYPERTLESLRKTCNKEFKKAKPGKAKFDPLVDMLRDAIEGLAPFLDEVEGEAKTRLAGQLLVLDGRLEKARAAIGHEQVFGRWLDPALKPLLEREVEVARALSEALSLDLEPRRITVSDEAFMEKLLGEKAQFVESWGLTVHSTMSREQTTEIMVEYGRAASFANFLLNGEVKPFRARALQFLLVDSIERYHELIDILQSDGRMPAAEATQNKNSSFFWDPRNEYLVVRANDPREFAAYLLAEGLDRLRFRPQQFLRAGLANYVCLAVLDQRLPRYTPMDGSSSPAEASASKSKFLRAESGLTGLRAHVASLVRRGRDPDWSEVFIDDIGLIQGNELMKNTEIMRFLCARGPIEKALSECHENEATDPEARRAQLEKHFGIDVAAFERQWRDWIVSEEPSLLEKLEALADSKPDRDRSALLDRINGAREAAIEIKSKDTDPLEALSFSAPLSQGASHVAKYALALDPRPTAWRELHTQDPKHEAFSLAGMRAAPNSLIALDVESPDAALDRWLATFYDRIALLHPGVLDMGFARVDSCCVLDCGSLVAEPDGEFMIRWPYDGMKRVPTEYAPELRNPLRGESPENRGYPISLQLFRDDDSPPGALTMELFVGNPSKGDLVECFQTSPTPNTYGLIPKEPLQARKQYTVVATFKATGQRVLWKFKT